MYHNHVAGEKMERKNAIFSPFDVFTSFSSNIFLRNSLIKINKKIIFCF